MSLELSGWHPKPIKFEPPSDEEVETFLAAVEATTLPPASKWWWRNHASTEHKCRVYQAYIFALDALYYGWAESPQHTAGLLDRQDIIQFTKLVEHKFSKELLATASKLLCLRERFMFAATLHKAFTKENVLCPKKPPEPLPPL